MSYPRLAARLYNTALMIEPGKAEVIEAVFRAYAEGRSLELPPMEARPSLPTSMERADAGYFVTGAGVAVLPIHGTLVQRTSGMDAMSGLTSYQQLSAQFQAAEADKEVRATVLEIDSPGGEAGGVFGLASEFMSAAKPVYAHANEKAFSAAYALGSAAKGGLYMAAPGMVGSVGVLLMHVDQSQMDAKRGLVYTPIFAGSRKVDFSSHAPLSDKAHATGQAAVDRLYQMFVDQVSAARGIDAAVVRGTEAGLLTPGQAIDLGMADGVESLAETIQRAADETSSSFTGYGTRPAGASLLKGTTMAEKDKPAADAALVEQLANERAAGYSAAQQEITPKVRGEGAIAERTRVKTILTAEVAKDRPMLAQHLAFETDMAPEAAVAMLAKAGVEIQASANPLATAMAGVQNPTVGMGSGGAEDSEEATVARIMNAGKRPQLKTVGDKK